MPDSTTQIKGPTARLHEWAEGNGFRMGTAAGDLVHEMVDAALAEAATGERAAIRAAVEALWPPEKWSDDEATGYQAAKVHLFAILDAREP